MNKSNEIFKASLYANLNLSNCDVINDGVRILDCIKH